MTVVAPPSIDETHLLSITIPSVVRSTLVDTVAHFRDQIETDWPEHLGVRPEVVVVANPLGPFSATQQDALRQCALLGARIEWHGRAMLSAEESSLAAVGHADATYVWLFGDDDVPLPGALRRVAHSLGEGSPDALLLNIEPRIQGFASGPYYRMAGDHDQKSTGRGVWEHFGFLTATTTISAWVLRRTLVDLREFRRYHEISPIYSHSFYLFSLLHDRPMVCLADPCLTKEEEGIAAVQERFDRLSRQQGEHPCFSWTAGVLGLTRAASRDTAVPVNELLSSHELEVIRDPSIRGSGDQPAVLRSTTRSIVYRFFQQLLEDDTLEGLQLLKRLQDEYRISDVVHAVRMVDPAPAIEREIPVIDLHPDKSTGLRDRAQV